MWSQTTLSSTIFEAKISNGWPFGSLKVANGGKASTQRRGRKCEMIWKKRNPKFKESCVRMQKIASTCIGKADATPS